MRGRFVLERGIICACALLFVAGCGDSDLSEPPVVHVEADDVEMQQAVDEARRTVDQFIAALESPTPSQTYLGIKARFAEGDMVEFMWLSDVTFDGETFTGTVANNPEHLTNVAIMDRHELSADEIQDWMIIDDGHLVGGYSVRVIFDRISEEEQAEMKQHMGITRD